MDPVTAALNIANNSLILATKVWDAMPQPAKETAAADYAKFSHNMVSFLTSIQDKINAAVAAK